MKTNPHHPDLVKSQARGGGYALITVLMMIALMTIMIVGLFVLVKDDRTRARSYMEVGRSRFLVDMASQEILAKLMDGSMVPWEDGKAAGSYTAAPGVIEMRKYKEPLNKGYHTGAASWTDENAWARKPFALEYEHKSAGDWKPANPLTIPLYSSRWFAPGIRYMTTHNGNVSDGNPDYNPSRVFNINTPDNPFDPGMLYISGSPDEAVLVKDLEGDEKKDWNSGLFNDLRKGSEIDDYRFQPGEAAVDRPLNVQWMPIYKFAGKGNTYTDELGRLRRNPVVGRYAYWVDVENTKVNINVTDRKFVDSGLGRILGETEALNEDATENDFYFIQNTNVRDPASSDEVQLRGKIERTMMNASEWRKDRPIPNPPKTIIDSAMESRGDNTAAVTYYNAWMDWQEDGTPPYLSDNSLVDWRVFTGIRPLAGGMGEDTSIEGLLADAAVDNDRRFNTFSEVFSLLDPKTEQVDPERGLAALVGMRRTYGNSATIYGWDEERDPLGRPKIDIVKLQNGGVGGPLFNELLNRLKDPDYYLAYHTGSDPSGNQSFTRGYNALVGDNNPQNNANGEAIANQMLTNIVEYGKPNPEAPYISESEGIVGAKSMPYVAEVATRLRNGFWRLYEPVKNAEFEDEDPDFDTMAADLLPKADRLVVLAEGGVQTMDDALAIDQALDAVLAFQDPAGIFDTRTGSQTEAGRRDEIERLFKAVTVDLNLAMVNPNPFAEIRNDGRNSYFKGAVTLNYAWHGVTPIESAATNQSEFEGLYVARSIPLRKGKGTPHGGIRVDGESVYFDLGLLPGKDLLGPSSGATALRIDGWEIRRDGAGLFHKVPIRHPGQTKPARSWWAMAQPETNPGMISSWGKHENHIDWFSLAHFYQPYNMGYQWRIPNVPIINTSDRTVRPPNTDPNPVVSAFPYEDWKNVSVGWFSARTIAEYCRTYPEEVVAQGPAGCLYLSDDGWNALTTDWKSLLASGDLSKMDAFVRGVVPYDDPPLFPWATKTIQHIANSAHRKAPSLLERVVSLDPTLGHRTGNPDAFQRAAGGHLMPDGVPMDNVGHFYGTNGHSWRLASVPLGSKLDSPVTQPPDGPGTPRKVRIYEYHDEEQEVTFETPIGNTFITRTRTITVRRQEEVGHKTVYDKPKGDGQSAGNPTRYGGHYLTDGFFNPAVTSVVQGDLLSSILQHHPLQTGWEVEAAAGIGTSKVGMARWNAQPWSGFFCSAPKGDLMASIGEVGFCHSGLLGRPIELIKEPFTRKDSYRGGDVNAPYVGSPVYGLSPVMFLDLLTPGAFRNNATGTRYSEAEWRAGVNSNTPENPRRGTWNMNAAPASDTYMAMRERSANRNTLSSVPTHPVWAPNGHGMAAGFGLDYQWLDPMMNPFPRYRRGFESWIAIMVGDYTPFRSRGEAIWGRQDPVTWDPRYGRPSAIRPGAYALLSAPVFSWRSGVGGAADSNANVIPFDPEYSGAQSALFTMGFVTTAGFPVPFSRYNTYDDISGLYYIDRGFDTGKPYRDPSFSMAEMARTGNFPLRHHNSELVTVSAQDVNDLHTALNPDHATVGWTKIGGGYHRESDVSYGYLSKYGSHFQPYQNHASSKTFNGHPGAFAGTGIYANAPVVLSANQVSTSANVFTAHIVTQAIRDNGNEREDYGTPFENVNTGLGYMDHEDEVLGEQWSQVVIARLPGDGIDPDTGGPRYEYRILYSRTLDHQVQ